MSQARRAIKKERKRVFLGGEGDSERSYGVNLKNALEKIHREVHLDCVALRGGDPLKLVEQSVAYIEREEKAKLLPAFFRKALLLDSDQLGASHARDQQAKQLAAKYSILLIWQEPCHEAFLLNHFEETCNFRCSTSTQAMTKLKKCWTGYEKGMSAMQLSKKISRENILLASCRSQALAEFLTDLGFN